MKFYYKGKLLRTSETHEYKYALVWEENDKVVTMMCSSTYEGAMKQMTSERNRKASHIEYFQNYVKAINEGKTHIWCKEGRRTYKVNIDASRLQEQQERLDYHKGMLERFDRCVKVVELEQR